MPPLLSCAAQASAGVSHNKLIAKLGSARNKPNKQAVVCVRGIPSLMREVPMRTCWCWASSCFPLQRAPTEASKHTHTPVCVHVLQALHRLPLPPTPTPRTGKLRGLGGKFGKSLEARGWKSVQDVQGVTLHELRAALGDQEGLWLYRTVRGVGTWACFEFEGGGVGRGTIREGLVEVDMAALCGAWVRGPASRLRGQEGEGDNQGGFGGGGHSCPVRGVGHMRVGPAQRPDGGIEQGTQVASLCLPRVHIPPRPSPLLPRRPDADLSPVEPRSHVKSIGASKTFGPIARPEGVARFLAVICEEVGNQCCWGLRKEGRGGRGAFPSPNLLSPPSLAPSLHASAVISTTLDSPYPTPPPLSLTHSATHSADCRPGEDGHAETAAPSPAPDDVLHPCGHGLHPQVQSGANALLRGPSVSAGALVELPPSPCPLHCPALTCPRARARHAHTHTHNNGRRTRVRTGTQRRLMHTAEATTRAAIVLTLDADYLL
jgi:hypothetical protein